MRLLIAGGGTGGHLFPGIAVGEELLSRGGENRVLFVGGENGIEARILPRLGLEHRLISAAGIRGKGTLSRIKGGLMLLSGYARARRILKEFRPDRVLGVGGYASGPVVLAARGMGIGCSIHEQNAIPGFTNRTLARFSDRVFISLEESARYFPVGKTLLTGNPIRKEILAAIGRERGKTATSDGSLFRLLVFGGSAGAHSINVNMTEALPLLSGYRERLSITHQTGANDLEMVKEGYGRHGFRGEVLPFIDDMAAAYAAADLIVCRAGATTIAEVTACGRACIFVPYPFAVDDHQRRNAEALVNRGAGFMILDRELSGESLAGMIGGLLEEPERIAAAGRKAAQLARPDAARAIVDELMKSCMER